MGRDEMETPWMSYAGQSSEAPSEALPRWMKAADFEDIRYEKAEGIAKITIARPEVRNAFRPLTVEELERAFALARDDPEVGVVILTGEGPDAFCSGGD